MEAVRENHMVRRALAGVVAALRRAAVLLVIAAAPAAGQDQPVAVAVAGDSVGLRFVDADLRAVVAALAPVLPKPLVAANLPGVRVSLETPGPVPVADVMALLGGIAAAHGLELIDDGIYLRLGPKPPPPQPAAPDPAAGRGAVELSVIRLRHAHAADVAATVNQLFGGGGQFSGRPGIGAGTLSEELQRSAIPMAGESQPPGSPDGPRDATLRGPVTVVPDAATNSLLVRASAVDFAVIEAAVGQLDIRPLQVLIEVLIVEARRDRSFSLGTDVLLPRQNVGQGNETIEGRLFGGGLGDLVIGLMNVGKRDIDIALGVAASQGNVEIVSRPVLLASNNTEARFLVGSQRPFVQISRTLPTDAPVRDQVVQYKDVGTKLVVRPTINQDGYVSLLLQQEISAATTETQFGAPVISTREASTQVLVRDGQTIVIGGLSDEQRDQISSGVPILSGIPIIGGLFGRSSRRSTATELYLFLTPRIIRSDEDAAALTAPRLPEDFEP
jgi:type II secretion system protein D